MRSFLEKHAAKVGGVISCFDRMLFRGYLPIMSGYSMAQFLCQEHIKYKDLNSFLVSNAAVLKDHAVDMARNAGRPYVYLSSAGIRKEERARAIAAEDGIEEGLVCVFSQLEPCNTFSFRYERGQALVRPARRKCLHIYYPPRGRDGAKNEGSSRSSGPRLKACSPQTASIQVDRSILDLR